MTTPAIQESVQILNDKRPRAKVFILAISLIALMVSGTLQGELLASDESQIQATNPRANLWRTVRDGQAGVTTDQALEQDVLIQHWGQNWRRIRNGLLAWISPWLLGGVFFSILLFFFVRGPEKLEEAPSGDTIERWSLSHRLLHWYTATLFILLALTGLSMLLGRLVLIPVFGHPVFSGYMGTAIRVHNYGGPFFLAGLLIEITAWFKPNIPQKMDVEWFQSLGGLIGKSPRPHAGRINGGSKAWFWFMALAGLTVGATGLMMDFPEFGETRKMFQAAHIIHSFVAVFFMTGALGHIYLGSIGAEGTFEGMRSGRVSVQWAKQHNDLWVEELMKEK